MNIHRKTPKGPVVIAIDGPAGAGKSTVAKALARRLGYFYLDTGAMYRALTLKAIENKINLEDEEALFKLASKSSIDLKLDAEGSLRIYLDGRDVSDDIRSSEVTNQTFYIARAPKVRELMVEWQRTIGQEKNIIAEGRDIGTVVFPNAAWKFYMDADFDLRTKRRLEELKLQGKDVNVSTLKEELQDRDTKDFTRKTGPLKKADDAIVIDSTFLTVEGTADKILEYINNHG